MQINKKKERIDISNIEDLKNALQDEGYSIKDDNIFSQFNLNPNVVNMIYKCVEENTITYRAENIKDFLNYIETITIYEEMHDKLCKRISEIKKLDIHRVEYEKEIFEKENVDHILRQIKNIKNKISININKDEKLMLDKLEREIAEDYLYAKDIELLKKMITSKKESFIQKYDDETRVKTISIEVPEKIGNEYIKPKIGTIEYHMHLNNNIPRLQRLIKNIHKYIVKDESEENKFIINQSEALQDSINLAVATFDNEEFKAISGSTEICNCCKSPKFEDRSFESSKVNRLGEIGVGYNRINDSEKKIFEEIHKRIENKELKDSGKLTIYTKWEPCLSCYYVISQFCERHPEIEVEVKYSKKYGE